MQFTLITLESGYSIDLYSRHVSIIYPPIRKLFSLSLSFSLSSAANAAIDHVREWHLGTDDGDWASMAVPSDGSYGIPEGIIYGFPCSCSGGNWSIVQGLEINEFSRAKLDATAAELQEEAAAVAHLV